MEVHEAVHPSEHNEPVDDAVHLKVKYLMLGRTEREIPLARVTIIPMPFKGVSPSLRSRREKTGTPEAEGNKPTLTALGWLKFGLKTRRHKKKGWLKDTFINAGLLQEGKDALWARVISDYKCQLSAIEGWRKVMGDDFIDPRD